MSASPIPEKTSRQELIPHRYLEDARCLFSFSLPRHFGVFSRFLVLSFIGPISFHEKQWTHAARFPPFLRKERFFSRSTSPLRGPWYSFRRFRFPPPPLSPPGLRLLVRVPPVPFPLELTPFPCRTLKLSRALFFIDVYMCLCGPFFVCQ